MNNHISQEKLLGFDIDAATEVFNDGQILVFHLKRCNGRSAGAAHPNELLHINKKDAGRSLRLNVVQSLVNGSTANFEHTISTVLSLKSQGAASDSRIG